MSGIFYLVGVSLAGYAGFGGLEWYLIFISSFIMAIGYFIIRPSEVRGFISNDGVAAIPKLLSIQAVIYSIITAPVYYATALI